MENVSVDTVDQTEMCSAARENDRSEGELESVAAQASPDTSGDSGTPEAPPSDDIATAVQPEAASGQGEPDKDELGPLSRYGLVERDGAVFTRHLEPVTNFTVEKIRSGMILHADGRQQHYHEADIRLTDGAKATWSIRGQLYNPKNWMAAGNGKVLVADGRRFQRYLFQRIERDGIQRWDPELCRSELVGIYRDPTDKLRVSQGLANTPAMRMSLYAGAHLPATGDKAVFDRVAALTHGDTVRAILVLGLGAPLKEALGGFYPHGKVEGESGSGKTTIFGEIGRRFGFQVIHAQAQLETSYRQKLALSGTTLPVFADEIGRLEKAVNRRLVNVLNVAYGSGFSTHGPHGKVFYLIAPLIGAGQDWLISDEALHSKIVIYRLDKDARDVSALQRLHNSGGVFPLVEYLHFACDFANDNDMVELLEEKIELLKRRMPPQLRAECAEADRCVRNHATQLVAAEVLIDYGVDAGIEDYLVSRLAERLTLFAQEGHSVAEKFVADLTTLLARRSVPAAAVCEVTDDGLYIHVESCLKALTSAGYKYDVDDPHTITKLLGEQGIGNTNERHYFNRVRKRCVLIAHERLDTLGHRIDMSV